MIKSILSLLSNTLAARRSRRLMRSLGVRRVGVPTLGTAITATQPERASDDYSHMFLGF